MSKYQAAKHCVPVLGALLPFAERKVFFMMDFSQVFKLKQMWSGFIANHPKLNIFFAEIGGKRFEEGTEIAIAVKFPDGTVSKTGIRLTASDTEMLEALKRMM